ncbi:hypothetical protein [Streptomyces sp. IMTB 1903]|uniref:hypothetical protein n=1 Tax=Streptomyces sp. IMTB 1903 TaxID=1776680 RepID=UPI00131C7E19|nr:hypothetical protein [Streptomyces sp. IMTB 1903]
MPGEDLHEIGADGARRAKEWLEATTRVKASWTNTDPKWSRRMTFKWPTGKQTQFSLDLGGLLCGGEFDSSWQNAKNTPRPGIKEPITLATSPSAM